MATMGLDALYTRKYELLALQKQKTDKINSYLAGPNGLNDISRKTCKNLEAAVAASKNPGVISYYQQPDEMKKIVETNELKKLQSMNLKLQRDIQAVDAEIREKEKNIPGFSANAIQTAQGVSTLSQWFSTYGEPKPTASGFLTSFSANAKVYGGTNHYSAFKTQSSAMKKGRLTK